MSDSPLFSIVIPTYNRPHLLARALESIRCSEPPDREVIVVNDGSTESYQSIKDGYSDLVRYHENTRSAGVASARNTGARLAKGRWLAFLDDDDELVGDYLQRVKNKIQSDSDCSAVWGGIKIVEKVNNCVKVEERLFSKDYEDTRYLINDLLTIGVGFGFCIDKTVFETIGMFDESFSICEDTELFVRLASNGYIPSPVPGIGVIKHEEHAERLSSDLEVYARQDVYNKILEKNDKKFLKKWRYNYIHLLMWSYRLHRQYGHRELEAKDLERLVQLGVPEEHIEQCYLSYSNLSDEYVN